jgi:hypothetical protein
MGCSGPPDICVVDGRYATFLTHLRILMSVHDVGQVASTLYIYIMWDKICLESSRQ